MPSTITLYGPPNAALVAKYKRWGYTHVEFKPRPEHDTGLGPCGKFQCSCESSCEAQEKSKIGNR
ncbi:hypothetical protein [Roseivirga thermotolerans]|uniref:hypothetical protein n=1 Tax=Roseivirga thermotolerans TaxID=1758176 RepID=UPI001671F76E|nr:hypothetical protein [Roseivirga thermotolerans]